MSFQRTLITKKEDMLSGDVFSASSFSLNFNFSTRKEIRGYRKNVAQQSLIFLFMINALWKDIHHSQENFKSPFSSRKKKTNFYAMPGFWILVFQFSRDSMPGHTRSPSSTSSSAWFATVRLKRSLLSSVQR